LRPGWAVGKEPVSKKKLTNANEEVENGELSHMIGGSIN
jgi:hypothetical protein